MPEIKVPIKAESIARWAGLLVAVTIAWAVMDSRVTLGSVDSDVTTQDILLVKK